MARLAQNLLSPLPLFTPPNHSYTIALINVRSLNCLMLTVPFVLLKPGLHPTLMRYVKYKIVGMDLLVDLQRLSINPRSTDFSAQEPLPSPLDALGS